MNSENKMSKEQFPEVLDSQVIYRSGYIQVVKDHLLYPNGETGEYIYFRRPDASLVIASTGNRKFYLINQYRYPSARSFTQFPLESQEDSEDPLICAKRGLEEEVGLKAKRWLHLGSFFTDPGSSSQQCHVFLAEGLEKGIAKHDFTENIEPVILSRKDIEELIKSGETESWLIAAWNLYLRSLS